MLDDFITSRVLLGAIESITIDTNVPWAPHFGILLRIKSALQRLRHVVLVRLDMPKDIRRLDEGKFKNDEFQKTPKSGNKMEQQKLAAA